jgi:hypothetical protein
MTSLCLALSCSRACFPHLPKFGLREKMLVVCLRSVRILLPVCNTVLIGMFLPDLTRKIQK